MLRDYRRLDGLLSQQNEALAEGDFETLRSLHEAIARLAERIAAHHDFIRLGPATRREIEDLILRINKRIRENQSAWQELIERIQTSTTQLRAQRRYFSALQSQEPAGTRYSRTG